MNSPKNNPKNDRVKRDYLIWLKDAKQRTNSTVDQVRHSIDRLETYTGFKDFSTFNKEQARAFKQALLETKTRHTDKLISIVTVHHTLQAIKEFLAWMHGRQDYRRHIKLSDIAYLNLTTGEERKAHTTSPKKYASVEDYRKVLLAMPTSTEIQRRDRALMALMLLSCMRDAAVISLKLKHIDIARRYIFQDPRQVKTKFSKAINTFFYPVGDDVETILQDWVTFLIKEKQFGPEDPLFPKTAIGRDAQHNFTVQGLAREHWANAGPVRDIFKEAFERAGLPYANPHSIRHTLTQFAYTLKLTPEEFKAWSQNMGHDNPRTTYGYGQVSVERQGEIIGKLGRPLVTASTEHKAAKIVEMVTALLKEN